MNLEDAFMQLFERKGRIGDQIRQQVRSHTETLSVNFVAAGGGDPSEFCWKNGAGAASDFSFPAGFTYQFGVSKEDTNIGRESEDAYKDIEDVSNKLSHVFAKFLIEGSNKIIVQTEGNGLEHATVSISPSVNIPEKIAAVDTENNNILEVSNRKRNSTPVKYPESKKHFFRNPTVLSTIPLSEYLEIIPSEKDNVPLDADELKTSNDPKEVCTIALERQYFSKSSTCNNRKVFSEPNRTSKSSKAVSYACNPNNTRFGRNKSEVKDSTASLSEYLEIIPSVKDSMFLDAYEPETSRGSKYEVVDGFVEKITMHDDLCNPSRQALNSASSLICNVNSTSHIFSKRQDAMVINRSRAVPLKHNLFLQTTTKTDDNYDITEDHMIASACLYFDRKVMSAEPNRTSKPSDDVPFACNYDMKCSEMSKREVRESLSIYGTSQRPRLNSFLDSNQCKLKISSVDTPEPIKGFYNSMLQNVSNDENMEFHNSTMLNTSLIKHSGDIQQMKLQVSKVVPESIDKKQERLTSFHKTVPEHGNPHILNDAVPLVFCKPASKHEYSSSSDHKEAIENRISCRSVSTLQDGQEEEGINGVTGGVYNSKGHRDSVADVDLLIGHIPNRKSSVLSGHSYVAQSRLSLKESNFSPCIGDAPSIMQTVVSPIEREEVKDVVGGNNNVVINIKNNDKPHKSSASETDFYSCDSDKVTQLHTVDQFIPLNLSPDFENFCFGDSDQDNSNIAKKSCNTEPYHLFYTSHISHSTPAKHLDYLSFLGSLDFNDNETNQYSCINESNIPLLRQSFSEEPVFKKFRSSLDIISPFNFQADSNSSSRECSTSKKSVNLEHICFPIDENACTTGEDVLVEPGKNAEEGEREKTSKEKDIISPFNSQADSNSSSRKCSTSKKSVNLEHICFLIDENACTTGEGVLVEPGKNAEEGEREKTSKEKDIISPFNSQADSNSSSRKCSTSKKSVNLEHICFPIDENACTTGEGVLVEPGKNAEEGEREKTSKEKDIILNKLEKAFEKEKILNEQEKIAQGGLTSELVTSGNEKTLGKKVSYPFTSQMPSTSQIFSDRGSPDSMTTEVNMYVQVNEKKSMGDGSSLRCKPMSKKRPAPLSILKNVSRLRSGKSKLSIKSCDENKSIAITAKGFKPTNILSNISSFIPLVQQKKQAVAIQTVKREIKVKSLEAAEAVRRNEERKEKERKMKKEASKLEKLRLDQEKVKQREINEKKKGEERKKELELNARKRQREEDQKNDVKKKKFRCLQEKSRQYKQQNKMHVENKGLQHNATEVNVKLAAKKNQELQPYEMTPFHDSDLEEENNKNQRIKAIPIWARKETLNKILQSQRHMDPTIIFKRKHAFGLETDYL